MISALTNVRDLIDWMGMKALVRDQRIHEVNQEHIDLIEKLKKRDVSAAVKSMAQHILLTEKNVLAWKQEKSS
jgi:DNA-binding GntR family transcriptional regulator